MAGVFILLACLTILVVVLSLFCFSDITHPADRSGWYVTTSLVSSVLTILTVLLG